MILHGQVPELKRELQRRQLNVVGTRRELTERLLEDDQRETLESWKLWGFAMFLTKFFFFGGGWVYILYILIYNYCILITMFNNVEV